MGLITCHEKISDYSVQRKLSKIYEQSYLSNVVNDYFKIFTEIVKLSPASNNSFTKACLYKKSKYRLR